jgi:hypothetical protein
VPELIHDEKELEKLKNFNRDLMWFKANYDEIKSHYKGQYVAIKDEEIIDSDTDVMKLFERLRKEKKYDYVSSLVVEYINEHKAEYIL